ncbi:MAG: hypothetical protein OEY28_02850, partial [Nitrospira sp.]|nr:hypothetical protein [Nitrospira sp.]
LEYEVYEDSDAPALPPYWTKPLRVRATARIDSITRDVTLAEIADLDNPLGYKGNYLVFPLRQANVLTKLMMLPYADAAAGLRDPDEAGNYSRSDFEHYVCCLKQRLSAEEFAALLPAINEAYQRILSSPGGDEEEVVVATGSLFIEALPGAHPILEDYKLRSRAADLAVLRADIRRKELENLRYAARIVEGELGDPDIDKLVQIQGSSTVVSGISE